MNFEQKYNELVEAIRKHRDSWLNGDDKCWRDNEDLYSLLPEGYVRPERDETVELELCKQYNSSCHHPSIKYISPQRRIEELEQLFKDLRNSVFDMCLRRYGPEREWEDESKEKSREEYNRYLKSLFDEETEFILQGKLDCKISTCGNDLFKRIRC